MTKDIYKDANLLEPGSLWTHYHLSCPVQVIEILDDVINNTFTVKYNYCNSIREENVNKFLELFDYVGEADQRVIINIVPKKWGTENIISQSPYGCKVMTLYPGGKVSHHFHVNKQESFLLIEGQLILEITDLYDGTSRKVHLTKKFDHVTLKPYESHTFYCPEGQTENTIFIEASSEDKASDNYRFTQSTGPKDTDTR